MDKVKVRVLYPSAFTAQGVDTEGADEVWVDKALAAQLVAGSFAERVEPEPEPSKSKRGRTVATETADVALKRGDD